MQDKTIHIVACEYLQKEIIAALEVVQWEVSLHFFPHNCEGKANIQELAKDLRETWGGKGHLWLLVGSPCVNGFLTALQEEPVTTICRSQCAFLLGEQEPLEQLQKEGAYVVTPGWLKDWRQHIKDWGFTQAAARTFFKEWCKSIVLLDTKGHTDSLCHLQDFAAYVERDGFVREAQQNQLALLLGKALSEIALNRQNRRVGELQEEKAQYAMVLDLYVRLTQGVTVQQLLEDTVNLLEILFVPKRVYYCSWAELEERTQILRCFSQQQLEDILYEKESVVANDDQDSLLFKLSGAEGRSLLFFVEQVLFPAYLLRYVNFVLAMKPVLELALYNIQLQENERLLKEQMLAFEEERFQVALESISSGVITIGKDKKIEFMNPSAQEITGWTFQEAAGKPFGKLISFVHGMTGELLPVVEAALTLGQSCNLPEETALIRRNQQKVFIEGKLSILQKAGIRQGLVMVFEDVTKKRSESRNREMAAYTAAFAERFTSLGMLAAGLAHEINQPLQALQTSIEGIRYWRQRGVEPTFEKMVGNLEFMSKQIQRIDHLVKHLRLFAKPDQTYTTMQALDISQVIPSALEMLATTLKASGIQVTVHYPNELPPIWGHKSRLEEMVVHLVNNSRYNLERSENTEKRIVIQVGVTEQHNQVFLRLEDNGPTIGEVVKEHIFEPFFAREGYAKEPSLGFWLIKCIAEAHQGEIEIGNGAEGGFFCQINFPVL